MKDCLDKSSMARQTENVKEVFQETRTRRVVHDVEAMRALAHRDRLAILLFLLAAPSRTATECAEEIGASPSACSYHLRELERFGYAERVDSIGDGRTRPWRAAAIGFSLGDWADDSPAARAARHAIGRAELEENRRLIARFTEAVDDLDPVWRDASDFHNFELTLTAEELRGLNEQVAALLSPYRTPVRADAPEGAAAVHVMYQAFPRTDRP